MICYQPWGIFVQSTSWVSVLEQCTLNGGAGQRGKTVLVHVLPAVQQRGGFVHAEMLAPVLRSGRHWAVLLCNRAGLEEGPASSCWLGLSAQKRDSGQPWYQSKEAPRKN